MINFRPDRRVDAERKTALAGHSVPNTHDVEFRSGRLIFRGHHEVVIGVPLFFAAERAWLDASRLKIRPNNRRRRVLYPETSAVDLQRRSLLEFSLNRIDR